MFVFFQVAQLEAYFRFNEYIDGERKRRLSQITNIPEHQIKVWFQNRRQKKKREEAEMLSGGGGGSSGPGGGGPGVSGLQFKEEPGPHMLHSMEEEEEDYPAPGGGPNHDDSGGVDEEPETGDPIAYP